MRPVYSPSYPGRARILLILPCNQCVKYGDYSLCPNWRIILRDIWEYVDYGIIDLAAIDSCKPGIVPWGEERDLTWCDIYPSYLLYYHREPWRRGILFNHVYSDLRDLVSRYRYIVYYVNVKAYREVLDKAREKINTDRIIFAGPSRLDPLSYRSRRERAKLRGIIDRLRESVLS
ncbi:MAG: hypothetical protein F7C36_01285 [Desulfurococcales archaeon]|nr:hypothetical protein [Desulfurococcales archaeon]